MEEMRNPTVGGFTVVSLTLGSQRTSSVLGYSVAYLKLKFDHVFAQADCFPDFLSALVCETVI